MRQIGLSQFAQYSPEVPPPEPEPDTAITDGTLAQSLNNDFIARQQELLNNGPDAFYAKQGADALSATPGVLDQLQGLRDRLLDTTVSPRQRQILAQSLDNHLIVSRNDVARHAAEQSLVWQSATAQNRIDLLRKQAGFDYGAPDSVANYADASESAAQDRVRSLGFDKQSPDAFKEVEGARSAVWRSAIDAALGKMDAKSASLLYARAGDTLSPTDAAILARQINAAKERDVGHDYLARLPKPDTQDLAGLDAAHQAATAQNNVDWPDNPSQRATNQHFIDVTFGQKKRDTVQTKADLDQLVGDWLNQPGQIERPPLPIWTRLNLGEQQAADTVLRRNAWGPQATGSDHSIILVSDTPEDDDPEYELKRREHRETPEGDVQHGHAPRPKDIVLQPPFGLPAFGRSSTGSPAPQSGSEAPPPSRSTIGPGPHAGESIPARSQKRNFTAAERSEINRIGSQTGCHTCGVKEPGSKYGDFVLDHQAPSRLSPPDATQRLYPQCLSCSSRQGGEVVQDWRKRQP